MAQGSLAECIFSHGHSCQTGSPILSNIKNVCQNNATIKQTNETANLHMLMNGSPL